MKMTAALALATLSVLSACEDISPLISDEMFADRLDLDGDGTLNAQDCAPNNKTITTLSFWNDLDGDGFGAGAVVKGCALKTGLSDKSGDCGDGNNKVFPGAPEVCNLIDDNCNDDVDEGFTSHWCRDKDQDGFGNPADCKDDCGAPNGYVGNDDDCNDDLPGVKPGATDVCDDTVDQNCDGKTDNAEQATLWFADVDSDGAGNPAVSFYSCKTQQGHVITGGDCNDGNPSVGPLAPEACEDLVDNDCDGVTDMDAVDVSWYRDIDGDGYGDPKVAQTACKPPAGFVGNDLDCDDTKNMVKPGIAEICNNGVDDNCDEDVNQCVLIDSIDLNQADVRISGKDQNDNAGFSLSVSNTDADNFKEILIGSHNRSQATGAFYSYESPPIGSSSLNNAIEHMGENTGDLAAYSLASECDLSGDGKMDVVIGAINADNEVSDSGKVYVFINPLENENPLSLSHATFTGLENGDGVGISVACCQINSDEVGDIVIGAYSVDTNGNGSGAVFIFFGPFVGTEPVSDADVKIFGIDGEQFGRSVSCAGDVNGDKKADLLVGAPQKNSNSAEKTGAAYLFTTPLNSGTYQSTASNLMIQGIEANSGLGFTVSIIADINHDQVKEIAVGAPKTDHGQLVDVGAVYVILGSAVLPGVINVNAANLTIHGGSSGDEVGFVPVFVGDINGDKEPDLVMSSPLHDGVGQDTGSVYVFTSINATGVISTTNAQIQLLSKATGAQAGRSIFLADLDSNGFDDILIGAPYINSGSGRVFVVYGIGF